MSNEHRLIDIRLEKRGSNNKINNWYSENNSPCYPHKFSV